MTDLTTLLAQTPDTIPVVKFTPLNLEQAPYHTIRAGVVAGDRVMVTRDIARALDYSEQKFNLMLDNGKSARRGPGSLLVPVRQAVDEDTRIVVRIVTTADAVRLITEVKRRRDTQAKFGAGQTAAERARMLVEHLPHWRIGPFNVDGETHPAIVVPTMELPGKGPFIRVHDIAAALGVHRSAAAVRMKKVFAVTCRESECARSAYFLPLVMFAEHVVFGQDPSRDFSAWRKTQVFPLELAAMLYEALVRVRPPGRAGEVRPHHASEVGRIGMQPVTAPAPVKVPKP